MDIVPVWILWVILATVDPKGDIITTIGEFQDRESCMKMAATITIPMYKKIKELKFITLIDMELVCIPVGARIQKDADKPLFQSLPRKDHK